MILSSSSLLLSIFVANLSQNQTSRVIFAYAIYHFQFATSANSSNP